jgi:hypothetical protein
MKHRKDQEGVMSDTPMDRTGIRDRAKESISSKNLHPHGSNCKIRLCHPTQIPEVWDTVHVHLERMSPHSEGELTSEDFYIPLAEGDMQLWLAFIESEILASMVTQIVPYPRKKVLRIISIAGEDMNNWIDNLPLIEDWALSQGCTSLECWGRKGWLKVLEDWKCSYHILTKNLQYRMH